MDKFGNEVGNYAAHAGGYLSNNGTGDSAAVRANQADYEDSYNYNDAESMSDDGSYMSGGSGYDSYYDHSEDRDMPWDDFLA